MSSLEKELQGVITAAIVGHIKPDGDCVGSCLALYNYIRENMQDISVDLYLQEISEVFSFLKNADQIDSQFSKDENYDVCFLMDAGDCERLGEGQKYFKTAKKTVCIDHHISNVGYAQINHIEPEISSTSELLYSMMDEHRISKETAECLYTGIVHDTGVFQYTNTSSRTMQIAGKLMDKGIAFTKIIDETFYEKTYLQNQILGRALLESMLLLEGKCIVTCIHQKEMDFYGVTSKDFEGIVNQLRITKGVECAIFFYETAPHEFKVSMRSVETVDVSKIASYFGGGGHIRAAGCTMVGTFYDVVNNLTKHIETQLYSQ